ncbi:hypothetical protein DH2020_005810 [Rehmannia glutinosa]|uniref:G-type lectin S-receptor-like serine/threonine-protein kinase n=1 Tax=Rehmannia glutinosa TaxID=99300 RepID=A0ABR0XH59_REHGL
MVSRIPLLLLILNLHCLATQVSSLDTLRQGYNLNSSSQLVSAKRIFTLGFYTPRGSNNSYLAVWYTNGSYPPVWIGNRENPIPQNTDPILTIDTTGKLIITRGGGESIVIYSGESGMNLSATLLDTGNFVVTEMSSNGSSGEILWQSFDYPTNTLLPGMKLGVNHRTGRNWTLSSWFDESDPASGAFTLEWDPSVRRLIIRRVVVYWTCGDLNDYYEDFGNFRIKQFQNIDPPDVFNLNYNFTNITTDEEEYFMYTLIQVVPFTPDERKVISALVRVTAEIFAGTIANVLLILSLLERLVVYIGEAKIWSLSRVLMVLLKKEELQELLTLEGYTDDNGGGKSHDLKLFTYASIQSATKNFSSDYKLGQGGFGPVYKGKTAEGQDIAIKLLSRQSGQGLLEFKTELILISKLQHVNLVKLLGFCIHGDDKMIIYDYMHNKSLDFFLFSPSKREQLDWQKRFNIIEGTAQGLLYLHNGYMAPEYAMQGIFSVKSDVYSFGVLIFEIVSGRKNNSFHKIEGPLSLVEYAWELWRKDSALELMDPTLRDSCIKDQVQRCINVGLLCVENHAAEPAPTGMTQW